MTGKIIERGDVIEFARAGIESAEAACTFLGKGDWLRDGFPLPGTAEREAWLAFWSDDTLAWEATLEKVLGRTLAVQRSEIGSRFVAECFERTRKFFDRDSSEFDSFFRSLEVRFLLRVFLPCVATTYQRPSTVFRAVVEGGNFKQLEAIVRLDTTVLHHGDLATMLSPAHSATRRERWELLQGALAQPPAGIEPRQVKYGIAALIRRVAKHCGQRVTLAMLLAMFDNAATVAGQGVRDPDFSHDPASFERGVRRIGSRLPHFC